MSEVIKDTIKDTTMTIGGDEWLFGEVKVELSKADTPNYVHIVKMIPGPDTDVPAPPDDLINKSFELYIDNQLISERDTDKSEETLLFKGNLGNISVTGERIYEGIAYDPSQQGFLGFPKGEQSGSLMNETVTLKNPYYGYPKQITKARGLQYELPTKKASEVVNDCLNKLGVDKRDIQLTDGGVTRTSRGGSVTGAYERDVQPRKNEYKIKNALNMMKEMTESTFWFSKDGTFHFGVPEPVQHKLRFITDASDGMTTGPYQSVRVIGSGIRSKDEADHYKNSMTPERRVEKVGVVAETGDGNKLKGVLLENTTAENPPDPVYTYRNAEISTDKQAESTAKNIAEDLAEQQAKGTVTVSGFPEVQPLDAVKMPQASNPDDSNYNPRQPMGGYAYQVYKVIHKINSSDGFKTVIHVSGLVNAARASIQPADIKAGYELALRETRGIQLQRE